MVFGSIANSLRYAFLRGIECFLLGKYISNFAEVTLVKRFTTVTPLGMSRTTDYDVKTASQIASDRANIFYLNMNITKFT